MPAVLHSQDTPSVNTIEPSPKQYSAKQAYLRLHHPSPSTPRPNSSPALLLEAIVTQPDSWDSHSYYNPILESQGHKMDSLESSWRTDVPRTGGAADPWQSGTIEITLPPTVPGGGHDKGEGSSQKKERSVDTIRVGPLPVEVWAKVMDTSKGRDKVLKIAQYSIRTYLYILSVLSAIRPLTPWFKSNTKRMKLAVSSLSLTRKCLLLLNPLHPLAHLLSPSPTSAPTLIRHLIDLASALSDDIFCLSRLGLVNRRTGLKADRWANRFWLLTTIIALYNLHLKTFPSLSSSSDSPDQAEARRTRKSLSEAKWTNRKLLADLVFSSYDVFRITWFAEPVKCAMGLLAALISTQKEYDASLRASLGR